jgi:DNA ligase-1
MHQIIKELESDNSRLAKEAILAREAAAGNDIFFNGCRLAYDAMITFGIKQVPEIPEGHSGAGLSWDEFASVAELFINRDITGNMAKMALQGLMSSATTDEWNYWYRRILIKDLRCGITDKTINKAVKGTKIKPVPVFECQLAHDGANHESKVCGEKLIEVKLDGVRVITIVYPNGRVDQYSRNGKELVNFPHIKQQFTAGPSSISEPMVFDGEVMSSSFQDLMKQVHRKSDVQSNDAVLYLFDCLSLVEFKLGVCELPQQTRSQQLKDWYTKSGEKENIRILEHVLLDLDTVEGQTEFKMHNKNAIENGYEGIMIKDPYAPYECKRSVSWLKQKPFIEVSLNVVNIEEGTGKNVSRLGALVCEGADDGRNIKVNVGSGFSDALRDTIFNDHASVMGQVVEVRADAITQNQDGTYSLRFPRFLRFRGFEPGEKI